MFLLFENWSWFIILGAIEIWFKGQVLPPKIHIISGPQWYQVEINEIGIKFESNTINKTTTKYTCYWKNNLLKIKFLINFQIGTAWNAISWALHTIY